MRRRPTVPPIVAVPLLALGLTGCADDPSAEEQRDDLVADLTEDLQAETDGALDDATATCVAEGLVDVVGVERFEEVVDAAAEGGEDPELRDQVIDVFSACDALEPILDLE